MVCTVKLFRKYTQATMVFYMMKRRLFNHKFTFFRKVGGFQYLPKFSLIRPHGCSLKEAWRHKLQQIPSVIEVHRASMVHFFMFALLFKEGQLLKKRICSSWSIFLFKSRPNLKWTLHPGKRSKVYFFSFKFKVFNPPPPPWSHSATTGCEVKL